MKVIPTANFDTLMKITAAFNEQTENRDLSSLAIASFKDLNHCVRDKRTRKNVTLEKSLAYLQQIIEDSSIPQGLQSDEKDALLSRLSTFSTRLHQLCTPSERIDAGILRLKNILQKDKIDLLWYITIAAEIAQVVIPLACVYKRI